MHLFGVKGWVRIEFRFRVGRRVGVVLGVHLPGRSESVFRPTIVKGGEASYGVSKMLGVVANGVYAAHKFS